METSASRRRRPILLKPNVEAARRRFKKDSNYRHVKFRKRFIPSSNFGPFEAARSDAGVATHPIVTVTRRKIMLTYTNE